MKISLRCVYKIFLCITEFVTFWYDGWMISHFQHLMIYRKFSNIRRTKSQDLNVSRLGLQLSLRNTVEAKRLAENEDVVGAASTGDAPTTSEWSRI